MKDSRTTPPSLPFEPAPTAPADGPLGRLRHRCGVVFLDTETTGADPSNDRIVELAMIKVSPAGERTTWCRRLHPGVPIPPDATAVHGISDADVIGCPSFADVADEIRAFLEGCALAGFNVLNFDAPLLLAEFERAGRPLSLEGVAVVDAMTVFHRKERRDLTAAVRLYLGRDHEGAHGALADAEASLEVLRRQLERYPDLPEELDALHRFCTALPAHYVTRRGQIVWKGDEAVLNFGKHRGRTLRDVVSTDRSFFEWILGKSDFDADLVRIVRDCLEGKFPVKPK